MVKNKRWIAGILAMLFLFSLCLVGCDKGNFDAQKRKILHVWHFWEDPESAFYQDLDTAIKTYESSHPDVVITPHTLNELDYKAQLATNFNEGGKEIDVFAFWGGNQIAQLLESGLLMPLNKYLTDDVNQNFLQNGFGAFQKGDQKYAVPAYGWVSVLYCNAALFEEHDVPLPTTLDDIVSAADAFSKKGVTPLALGGEDGWQLDFLFESLLVRSAGAQKVTDFLGGKIELADDPAFASATDLFKSFASNNVLGKTPTKGDAESADDVFLQGEAAMRLTGSWLAGRMESMDTTEFLEKVKVLPFPQVTSETGQPVGMLTEQVGGFTQSFFVNNRAVHKNEAADLCLYLSEVLGNSAEANGLGYSAWIKNNAGASPIREELSTLVKDATMLTPSWDVLVPTGKVDGYVTAVKEVFIGKITTLEFLNKLKQYVQP